MLLRDDPECPGELVATVGRVRLTTLAICWPEGGATDEEYEGVTRLLAALAPLCAHRFRRGGSPRRPAAGANMTSTHEARRG